MLGWLNVQEAGSEYMLARVRDPDAPRVELVGPLPMPGLIGLYPIESGVRVLMTAEADPGNGAASGGWSDLGPDGFGPLHAFEIPTDGLRFVNAGPTCASTEGASFATAFGVCADNGDSFGVTVVEATERGAVVFQNVFSPLLATCAGGTRFDRGTEACVSGSGSVSAIVRGTDAAVPLVVVEWRTDDGAPLHEQPIPLGDVGGELHGSIGVDALGKVYFVLAGSPSPRIEAYRIESTTADRVDSHALDAFPDQVVNVMGVVTLRDHRLVVVYRQSGVLSVIPFDADAGFGEPVLVANVNCIGPQAITVQTPSATYLPLGCFLADQLTLLRICGG